MKPNTKPFSCSLSFFVANLEVCFRLLVFDISNVSVYALWRWRNEGVPYVLKYGSHQVSQHGQSGGTLGVIVLHCSGAQFLLPFLMFETALALRA